MREEYVGQDLFGGFGTFFQVDAEQQSESFITFSFHDSNGDPRRGVVAVMQAMTPLHAYETTRNLIERYHPEIMVNVGIAGALSDHLRLGDVLFASYVDNYDSAGKASAAGPNEFELHWSGQPYGTSEDLFRKLQRIWAFRKKLQIAWQDRCEHRLNTGIRSEIISRLSAERMLGDRRQLEARPIASGDTVGAAGAFKAQLLERNRKLFAIDMESAGFLKARIASHARRQFLEVLINTPARFGFPTNHRQTNY